MTEFYDGQQVEIDVSWDGERCHWRKAKIRKSVGNANEFSSRLYRDVGLALEQYEVEFSDGTRDLFYTDRIIAA